MLKQIVFLIVLLSVVHSTSINFQLENQSCPDNANFLQVLYNLPTCIVEKFFSSLVSGFVYSSVEFLDNSLKFIITGPNLDTFCSPYSKVMKILESLYTLVLMGVGAYYIFGATEPENRTKAKLWIQSLFFMIAALSFSFAIFKMIMDLNMYITTSIYSESFSDTLNISVSLSSLIFGLVMSFVFLLSAAFTFLTLLIRYIMIPFLLLMFPIALFLYFVPFTKDWGSFLLRFIVIIIFMTAIDAVIVLGMSFLFSSGDPNMSDGFVRALMLMLGFGLIGVVNFLIYIIAVLSLVFGFLKGFQSTLSAGWKVAMLASLL